MRDDKPGDLALRMVFARMMGNGPDAMNVRPALHISDGTSGLNLEIELTPSLLTELLAGGEARVAADKVSGFKRLRDWGKYHKMVTRLVPFERDDYGHDVNKASDLPHVAKMMAEIEADGYVCDRPRRNNARQWVIIGRRYDDQP